MIRIMLIGVISAYRWMPPRRKRCSLTPGCSARALAGVLDGTMGVMDVAQCAACCPEHTSAF
jgi:hypothetical protein